MRRDDRDLKKNRSDRYQWVLVESPCSPEMMQEIGESQYFVNNTVRIEQKEKLFILREQLTAAFWRIIDTELTPRQREVIHLYADGYTQIEIAKKLNVNQSSITKSLNGNSDYRNCKDENPINKKKKKRIYGGAKKKLRRIAAKDPEIQEILKQIAELQDN